MKIAVTSTIFIILSSAICFALTSCAADGPSLSSALNPRAAQLSESADFGLQAVDEPAKRVAASAAAAVPVEIASSLIKDNSLASSASVLLDTSADLSANQTASGKLKTPPVVVSQSAFDTFDIHQEEITSVAITKDGSRAYTGGSDGSIISSTIIKPDSKNKQGRRELEVRRLLKGERGISAIALSPDERYLAIAQFSSVLVYDIEEKVLVNRMTRITGKFPAITWDPRGELVAFGRTSGEVYAWHIRSGKAAGKDSLDAIEQYGTAGGSGVRAVIFHPSARAFLVAEDDGGLTVWRLLRTERELGLRDEHAEIDDTRSGSKNTQVGKIPSPIDDVWMDARGEEIFVSANDGNIYRWKVRGLQQGPVFQIGVDSVQAILGIDLRAANSSMRFLVTSGRGQRIKFWCRPKTFNDDDNEPSYHRIPVLISKDAAASTASSQPLIIDGRLVLPEDANPKPLIAPKKIRAVTSGFLAGESGSLLNPLSEIRSGKESAILWGVEKKGSLLVFDSGPILSSFRSNCPAE